MLTAVLGMILGIALVFVAAAPARADEVTVDQELPMITSDAQREPGSAYPMLFYSDLDQNSVRSVTLEALKKYRAEAYENNYTFDGVPLQTYLTNKGISYDEYVNVKWNQNMEAIALQRSAEAAVHMSHTRPDGTSCFTASQNGVGSSGECLAWGTMYMSTGLSQWYSEKDAYVSSGGTWSSSTGHYYMMINPDINEFGAGNACIYDHYGNSFASQCLEGTYGTVQDQVSLGYSGWYMQTVFVNDIPSESFEVGIHDANIPDPAVMVGQGSQFVSIATTKDAAGWSQYFINWAYPYNYMSYTSSDTSVATVDARGIVYGHKVGTTTITMKAGTESISVEVKVRPAWDRLWGENAYQTMQAVVEADGVFADSRGGTVIVATGDGYWDALSASGIAGTLDAPIVTTPTDHLGNEASAELARLKPQRVIVMGGKAAITEKTLSQIQSVVGSNVKVDRVAGDTARGTALEALKSGSGWGDTAIVATASGYWDALSIAPYAYWHKAPIILTNPQNKLDADALEALGKFKNVVIVGGEAVVSADVEGQLVQAGFDRANITRLAGANSIATSQVIASWEIDQGMSTKNMCVATGEGYWDALAGAPLAGKEGSVLVLSNPNRYEAIDQVYDPLTTNVTLGHVLGGTAAVPEDTWNYLLR